MDKSYSKKGLVIVAPEMQGSSSADIEKVVKAHKIGYAITKTISGPSLGNSIPRIAVFDTTGKLVFAGHPADDGAEKAIKAALKGVNGEASPSGGSSIFDKKEPLVAERSWTNADGKVIKATLISLDGDTGHFKFPSGKPFDYDIKKLSDADQEVIKKAAADLAAAAP